MTPNKNRASPTLHVFSSRCSNQSALVLSSSYSSAATLLCCDKFYQEHNLVVGTLTIPPKTVGNNGHFIARFYDEWYIVRSNLPGYISVMEVCLNGSGAVSFIDYTKCSRSSSSILPYWAAATWSKRSYSNFRKQRTSHAFFHFSLHVNFILLLLLQLFYITYLR